MVKPVIIRGGRLIDPHHRLSAVRDLVLRDGRVAEISERAPAIEGARVIDATNCWVLPGLIDLHVHFREPGEEGKETILTGSRAAVAGGFTAVMAMPNTRPVNDNPLVTRFILGRAKEAGLCDVFVAGAISKGLKGEEMAEIGELVAAGCRCITDDGQPVMSGGLLRRVFLYSRAFNLPVMLHEEDLSLSARGTMTEGPRATRMGLMPIPGSAETSMVARDLEIAEETSARVHLAHLSCAGSVRLLRDAKRRGLNVTAEATPHHFTLTDAAVEGYNTNAKTNPPVRQLEDVKAIREALADGTIDAIATDHAPHGPLEKDLEFDKASNGIIGLETALPLALELVQQGVLSKERAVELLTIGPARAMGLPGGHLAVGAPANVTVVDPEARWTVNAMSFFSKSRNTPFHGRSVTGKVSHTIVGGRLVFEGGRIAENLE
jgi:dihydroorotase